MEEVILRKFELGMRLLLNKYYNQIVAEQKEYEKIEKMQQDINIPNVPNF